ncbi:protein EDS1L-like [Gastrolobium bilobum]|uniref:protein EDS1L-like n=1 Tax=Gastrolobium bilobum TaxID=150636 RepID=UPI002AAF5715|nr:protein EDS1L-like [Gastrolobium bilobum]XP_061369738.1 protein EDS1L-like [Gastrolobium bilobum]
MAARGSGWLGDSRGMSRKSVEKALNLALEVQNSPDKLFLLEEISESNPPEVIISFQRSVAVKDWYSNRPFGETRIKLDLFPSLKSIGNDEAAFVNEAFQQRFKDILDKTTLEHEVRNAMTNKKKIVFTGHSSGGPVAILATLWALDKCLIPISDGGIPPQCVTFGSPLVGNHIFSHATRRENWSRYFWHFVMRYDIVPRILLAPLSSFDKGFELQSFNPIPNPDSDSYKAASDFYFAIMSNVATVTSHAACKLMGSTPATLENLAKVIPLSPYKPFGTYIFCTENGNVGKLIVIENPDAVLQLMFFSAQLSNEAEKDQVPCRSLQQHFIYGTIKSKQTLHRYNCVSLDKLEELPLSEACSVGNVTATKTALNDLGLSTRARLCLLAAAELEDRRSRNKDSITKKKDFVEEKMKELEEYKNMWERESIGYYYAFKVQNVKDDFKANVNRLKLAGVWDEIIEKLRSYELPDEFEGNEEWVELGTRFRRLVEPLDIANYYRHLRHLEGGLNSYMGDKGRPKRYRYIQRWLEHKEKTKIKEYSESCFWAEVEDLRNITTNNNSSFENVEERVAKLEAQRLQSIDKKELADDVFLKGAVRRFREMI